MQEMPGTRMAFVGIKNDKDIADLWAYLKQFGADGAKKWNPDASKWGKARATPAGMLEDPACEVRCGVFLFWQPEPVRRDPN